MGKRIAHLRAAEREMQTKEDSVRLETPAGISPYKGLIKPPALTFWRFLQNLHEISYYFLLCFFWKHSP